MKTNDLKELQGRTQEELKKLLQEGQAGLMQLKLDHQQNKLKNTRSIFTTRKNIAIIKTIMNMKRTIETKEKEVTTV